MPTQYKSFANKMSQFSDISNAIAVLSWDNEVNLPESSHQLRAQQIATLSGFLHNEFTSTGFGKLLFGLDKEKLSFKQKKNVELTLKDYKRDHKFSTEFVVEKSNIVSKAYHAWSIAKSKNDFAHFEKPLNDLLDVIRKEAEIIGYKSHPYDALIDLYEPNMNVVKLDKIFLDVKSALIPFIKQLPKKRNFDKSFKHLKFAKQDQWLFGLDLLKSIGYDFKRGRQDISTHPFTISFGTDDVRITTRIDEKDFANMTWSCLHEGGHAMYEQGLNPKEYGLPSGSPASLGIHESQSRFWENNIGRSKAFWKHQLPKLKKYFPQQLSGVTLNHFFNAVNNVSSGKIRTEADELHYHLHVLIRYELEKEIFQSSIKAKDLKQLWNEKYKKYLGVKINNDNEGILQDVHWAHGNFGYFPTYSLGSFYAAQFFAKIESEFPSINASIAKGDYSQLHAWLNQKIYKHGKTYSAEDLCKKATGSTLEFQYFMRYITAKYKN